MDKFIFSYPTKVYFGKGSAEQAFEKEHGRMGKTVMLAYGGGSVKKNGIYNEIRTMLEQAGKRIVEFDGIMPNPTYAKAQEGAALAREKQVDFILAVGGGSVIDCCKVISAQAWLEEDHLGYGIRKREVPCSRNSDRGRCNSFRYRRGDERRRSHHLRGKEVERAGLWNDSFLCSS